MSRPIKECCGSAGPKHRAICQTEEAVAARNSRAERASSKTAAAANPSEPNKSDDALLKRISELERRDEENQKKLQTLYAVADKSRLFNHENSKQEEKGKNIKLSIIDGKYLVGWANLKDDEIFDPKTGRKTGEAQALKIILLDNTGLMSERIIESYGAFSNLRYDKRVECPVLSMKQDMEKNVIYDVQLPDGRIISLAHNFWN